MKYKPFHPILFAIHPVLFLYSQNAKQFPPGVMIVPVLVCFATAASWMLLLRILTVNRHRSFCILSLSFLLLFSYGHTYSILESSGISANPKTALIVYATFFLLVIGLFYKAIRQWERATLFFNILGLVLVSLSLLSAGYTTIRISSVDSNKSPIESEQASATSPDIFYIVLDGYPRSDVLRRIHGFDNSQFLSSLESNGFRILQQSHSNYAGTSLSIAATLNYDYLNQIVPQQEIKSDNQWYLKDLIGQNRVLQFLKSHGYATAAFDSGYFQTEMKQVDYFYATGWLLNEFHEALLDTTPAWVLFKNIGRHETQRRRILYILDHLPSVKHPTKPVFVFAHIMALHPPFVFGPNGEDVRKGKSSLRFWEDFGGPTPQELSIQYQQQLVFMNKKVAQVVGSILTTRTRPVCIVIQGDHGSSFESPQREREYYKERFSILNAVRLPEEESTLKENQLYDSMSSVNTFRAIFNGVFGTELPLLPDRSFYSVRSDPFHWKEVTRTLKE